MCEVHMHVQQEKRRGLHAVSGARARVRFRPQDPVAFFVKDSLSSLSGLTPALHTGGARGGATVGK